MIDEVIKMLVIKLHKRAAFKHVINKIVELSITAEVKSKKYTRGWH
jgi:hypothetical protein